MKTKALLVLFFTAVFIISVTGCKKGDLSSSGKVINILGPIAQDEDIEKLKSCFKPFEKATGIKIAYEGTKEFESLIYVRAEAGNPPDVAMFPQPGGVINLARKGMLVPMGQETISNIKSNYSQGWIDLMTIDGTIFGVVHRVNLKSIVWYPKKAWEKRGWKIPKTWDELKALSDKMVAEGETPWSVGMESGAATGWVATDWIEDIMLRTAGPKVYDDWVANRIPFNDPSVKRAVEIMGEIWFAPKYVYGGRANISTTAFGDASKILFENPPKAWMHRQGNFITNFFPEEIQKNLDAEVGVFALPSIDEKYKTPVLGGGDLFVAFNDRPEIHEFMKYLTTSEAGAPWQKSGGALFAYKDQDISLYQTDIDRSLAEILINAEVFRFDGSDMMPSEVGSGAFWKEMVNYVSGKDLDKVLTDIKSQWPK